MEAIMTREDIERQFAQAMGQPSPLSMPEQQLLISVGEMCVERGIRLIHIPNKRPSNATKIPGNSIKGFPDLLLVGKSIVFAELKTQAGRYKGLPTEQLQWKYALIAAGAIHFIWSPEDLESGEIARVLDALSTSTRKLLPKLRRRIHTYPLKQARRLRQGNMSTTINQELMRKTEALARSYPPRSIMRRTVSSAYAALSTTKTPQAAIRSLSTFTRGDVRAVAKQIILDLLEE